MAPYFDALRSARRLDLLLQASDALYEPLASLSNLADPFAQHPELAGFWLLAGDGHYHAAAVHDPRVLGAKDFKPNPPPRKNKSMDRVREEPAGTQDAAGHFFALNLRNQLMSHLVVADQEERRKPFRQAVSTSRFDKLKALSGAEGEHDMRALKALTISELRMGAPKGTKVLYAWDRAGIDFLQWHKWKQSGVYFISLEKANMTLDEVAAPRLWDRQDKRNAGVVADECCGTSAGVLVRRVRWIEPESGEEFAFITSEMTLPPGLIAEIYRPFDPFRLRSGHPLRSGHRQRWSIERLFDETKTKPFDKLRAWRPGERKARASSATAKKAQALFLCMAHNLMVHLEGKLASEEGVRNGVEAKRREERMAGKIKVAKAAGREVPSMWQQPQQPAQRCVKFIRWLRCWFFVEAPWRTAVAALATSFASG